MLASITPAHERLQAELQALLGSDLAVVCTGIDGHPESLWPDERAVVAKAILRRQREFAAGRAAARDAMRRLGQCECAIPALPDRSPSWPEELVGSISHSARSCIAVVALQCRWASVGIDIEEDQRIEPELWPSLCSPQELQAVARLPSSGRKSMVTRIFSAKEAYFKWQYPRTRQMLEFQDVEIFMNPDELTFEAAPHTDRGNFRNQSPITGKQLLVDGQIFSFVAHRAPIRPALVEVM